MWQWNPASCRYKYYYQFLLILMINFKRKHFPSVSNSILVLSCCWMPFSSKYWGWVFLYDGGCFCAWENWSFYIQYYSLIHHWWMWKVARKWWMFGWVHVEWWQGGGKSISLFFSELFSEFNYNYWSILVD